MTHMDWSAWDAWMEANDYLVQQGIVPSCEEITRMTECAEDANDPATLDRNANITATRKIQRDERVIEESHR